VRRSPAAGVVAITTLKKTPSLHSCSATNGYLSRTCKMVVLSGWVETRGPDLISASSAPGWGVEISPIRKLKGGPDLSRFRMEIFVPYFFSEPSHQVHQDAAGLCDRFRLRMPSNRDCYPRSFPWQTQPHPPRVSSSCPRYKRIRTYWKAAR
jgi:hypothetical protein